MHFFRSMKDNLNTQLTMGTLRSHPQAEKKAFPSSKCCLLCFGAKGDSLEENWHLLHATSILLMLLQGMHRVLGHTFTLPFNNAEMSYSGSLTQLRLGLNIILTRY